MPKKLALIHTGAFLAAPFTQLCQKSMPDVQVFNIVDESLIQNTIAAAELTPTTSRRLAGYIESAEEAGADAIMVTCSSMGPAVEAARAFVDVPVLRVDGPMADQAVGMGHKIGVIATLRTTLSPTSELIRARAEVQGRTIEVVEHLCQGAFEAFSAGDTDTHDRLVTDGLKALMGSVDVIVLAQASMARVVETLPEADRAVPILSSPELGVEGAKRVLEAL